MAHRHLHVHLHHGFDAPDFKESEHPRAPDGKFGHGGGGASSSTGGGAAKAPAAKAEANAPKLHPKAHEALSGLRSALKSDKFLGHEFGVKWGQVEPEYGGGKGLQFEVRDLGQWRNPPDKHDEEDYDWQEPTPETMKKVKEAVARMEKAHGVKIDVDVGEKNWMYFAVRPQKEAKPAPAAASAAAKPVSPSVTSAASAKPVSPSGNPGGRKLGAPPALDLSTMKKVGSKTGGSLPGAVYRDAQGHDWLVKQTKSADLSHNEVLAGKLYKAAGVLVPTVELVKDGDKMFVGSKMLKFYSEDANEVKKGELPGLRDGFAVDAWLGNWDAAGLTYDNIGMVPGPGGKQQAVRVDLGGALRYRGMGAPKGDKFGSSVGEIKTMRDPSINPQNARAFGKVTEADIRAGVRKIASIPDGTIRDVVDRFGPEDAKERAKLADTLIARKQDLIKRYG